MKIQIKTIQQQQFELEVDHETATVRILRIFFLMKIKMLKMQHLGPRS